MSLVGLAQSAPLSCCFLLLLAIRYIVRLFGVQKKGACNVRVYGHEAEAVTFTAFKHLEYTFEAAPQGPAVRNEAGASATASTAVSVVAAVALAALLVVVAARPS